MYTPYAHTRGVFLTSPTGRNSPFASIRMGGLTQPPVRPDSIPNRSVSSAEMLAVMTRLTQRLKISPA